MANWTPNRNWWPVLAVRSGVVLPIGQFVSSPTQSHFAPQGHVETEGQRQEQSRKQAPLLRLNHPQSQKLSRGFVHHLLCFDGGLHSPVSVRKYRTQDMMYAIVQLSYSWGGFQLPVTLEEGLGDDAVLLQSFLGIATAIGSLSYGLVVLSKNEQCVISRQYLLQSSIFGLGKSVFTPLYQEE